MQLNCRRRSAMQLTQLNSVQPISANQVSRVFVPSAALWCVIYQPATSISWEMFSSAAAFFTRSLKALVVMSYKQAFFSIILLTFLQILHSKIPSPGKLVKTRHIWRHDLQTESTGSRRSELISDSCSRCERVDNSTSSWVELSCVAINGPLACMNNSIGRETKLLGSGILNFGACAAPGHPVCRDGHRAYGAISTL